MTDESQGRTAEFTRAKLAGVLGKHLSLRLVREVVAKIIEVAETPDVPEVMTEEMLERLHDARLIARLMLHRRGDRPLSKRELEEAIAADKRMKARWRKRV